MSREGSLEAPVRHVLDWRSPDFYDEAKLDAEMRRVFDICHGCRRCFNLCDSFPRLFDLVDESPSEVEGVKSEDFSKVTEACTLCDMCFMTKCPYVPPHAWQVDFPHLLLRHRMVEARKGKTNFTARQLAEMDRNGRLIGPIAPLANWASEKDNALTRPLMEKTAGIDRKAELPAFARRTFIAEDKRAPLAPNANAPAYGRRKAALYATCFVNYNNPGIGEATQAVLARNGVETKVVYPRCCGMPQLEHGELAKVADNARAVARELAPLIDQGHDIVALVPSCALMLKFEWPLIVPDDPLVKKLADATFDISEYVVDIAKRHGLAPGLKPLDGGVAVHLACHARAQNMGPKAAELLRLIPQADVAVIERCSGHGGSWGVMKANFETAIKVGKPVARSVAKGGKRYLASECPLAGEHIVQGMQRLGEAETPPPEHAWHPIELFARAYSLRQE
mgnify:CR=1 FL=1